jgi:hypothetical protein
LLELRALWIADHQPIDVIESCHYLLAFRQFGFRRQFLDDLEVVRQRCAVCLHECPRVAEQIHAIRHAQFRQLGDEEFP